MTLSDDIKRVITAVRIDLRGVREIASRMGHAAPGLANDAGEIGLRCIDILARLNELEAGAAAKRMVAEEEPLTVQRPVSELALFAGGGQECPRSLLLASLHRAGDHTLDDDGEPAASECRAPRKEAA